MQEGLKIPLSLKQSEPFFKSVNVIQDYGQELRQFENNSFQQILMIDVFEHVEYFQKAVNAAHNKLMSGGLLVVSVPTHYYPFYFGRKFDRDIGHLRHFSTNYAMNLKQQDNINRTIHILIYIYTLRLSVR